MMLTVTRRLKNYEEQRKKYEITENKKAVNRLFFYRRRCPDRRRRENGEVDG